MKILMAIHRYDVLMFTWLNIKLTESIIIAARHISKTADGWLYVLLGLTLFKYEGLDSPLLQTMLLAFPIERSIYFVLKNSFKRNRPADALDNFISVIKPSDQFSFPSGHTSAAFMMATLLNYFLLPFADSPFIVLLYGLFVWAALVGMSRIVLGVHFPTDTLMGATLGTSTALFSVKVLGL
jgi:undecaprenyl-diphosphatase